jgi:hypothetical protein
MIIVVKPENCESW